MTYIILFYVLMATQVIMPSIVIVTSSLSNTNDISLI